jgi:hypothetical protein
MELNPELYLVALKQKAAQQKSKRDDIRADLIGEITDKLNLARKGTKWKPLTYAAVGVKVKHVKTPDLRDFFFQCEKSDNFSRCFWG